MASNGKKDVIVETRWEGRKYPQKLYGITATGKRRRLYDKDSLTTESEIRERGYTAITNVFDLELEYATLEEKYLATKLYVSDRTAPIHRKFPSHGKPGRKRFIEWVDTDDRTYAEIK